MVLQRQGLLQLCALGAVLLFCASAFLVYTQPVPGGRSLAGLSALVLGGSQLQPGGGAASDVFAEHLLENFTARPRVEDSAIDAVYTWVSDLGDPERFYADLASAVRGEAPNALGGISRKRLRAQRNGSAAPGAAGEDAVDARVDARRHKFRDWGELRYSMRSLAARAPWVRTIFIIVADASQVPPWLDRSHPRVRIVLHSELFRPGEVTLPTYNSYAIESVMHRIAGLSEFFLYLNSDWFLGNHLAVADLRTSERYVRLSDWSIDLPPRCQIIVYPPRSLNLIPPPPRRGGSIVSYAVHRGRRGMGGAWGVATPSPSANPSAAFGSSTAIGPLLLSPSALPSLPPLPKRNPGPAADHPSIARDALTGIAPWDAPCANQAYVFDAILSRYFWGERISAWPAHAPRIYERSALAFIADERLAAYAGRMRASRLRDAAVDFSVAIQYESWLASCAHRQTPGAPKIAVRNVGYEPSLYLYVNMGSSSGLVFYNKLRLRVTSKRAPTFIGIDDNLHDPSPEQLAANKAGFTRVMRAIAPERAPWEMSDDDANADAKNDDGKEDEEKRETKVPAAAPRQRGPQK